MQPGRLLLIGTTALWAAACMHSPLRTADDIPALRRGWTPGVRIAGDGYSALPPPGTGWSIVRRNDEEIVFGKRQPVADARRSDGPYLLLTGVQTFAAEGGADLMHAAKSLLTRRLQVPSRQLLTLDLRATVWHASSCVDYDALQVDRFDFDEPKRRYDYSHHGRICRLPESATRWIQIYRSDRRPRSEEPAPDWREAQTFMEQVLPEPWSP